MLTTKPPPHPSILNHFYDFFQSFEQVAIHRIKLLEEKISLMDLEKSEVLQKIKTTETTLAERCLDRLVDGNSDIASDDTDAKTKDELPNSNQTIAGLVQLLNSHHGSLLASRNKVKKGQKENLSLKKALSKTALKISELEEQLSDSEARLRSMSEKLESAEFDVNFCKADLMEKETELKDLEAEFNVKVSNKMDEASVRSVNEELNLCRKKFEQDFNDEQERLWDRVWKKQNYGMCVQACNMMKTAACKIAFNYLPYKDYLIDCS